MKKTLDILWNEAVGGMGFVRHYGFRCGTIALVFERLDMKAAEAAVDKVKQDIEEKYEAQVREREEVRTDPSVPAFIVPGPKKGDPLS